MVKLFHRNQLILQFSSMSFLIYIENVDHIASTKKITPKNNNFDSKTLTLIVLLENFAFVFYCLVYYFGKCVPDKNDSKMQIIQENALLSRFPIFWISTFNENDHPILLKLKSSRENMFSLFHFLKSPKNNYSALYCHQKFSKVMPSTLCIHYSFILIMCVNNTSQ